MLNLDPIHIVAIIPAILMAITIHEFGHGLVAHWLGDPTPERQGRLTLNPLSHLDIMGALLFVVAGFGWAKPVEVNPVNFNRRLTMRQGMTLVSLAGPIMNVILAFIVALILNLIGTGNIPDAWMMVLSPIIWYNIILAAFNLIPVPPLDGSKILAGLLPRRFGDTLYRLEMYGPFILMALILTGLTRVFIYPVADLLSNSIGLAVGVIMGFLQLFGL